MQTALYLYNSKEIAAADFAVELKRVLEGTGWELNVDFDGAIQPADNIWTTLHEAIRRANAIVYAVGPLGPGAVQGNFELSQILQAQHAAKKKNNDYKIIPTLLAGATTELIPLMLDISSAAMDNTHRQGRSVLQAVYRALTGSDLPADLNQRGERASRRIDDATSACGKVADKVGNNGLTIFVGPYAAADVYNAASPSMIGSQLLNHLAQKKPKQPHVRVDSKDTLLNQPWMAALAGRLSQEMPYDQDIWLELKEVVEKSVQRDPYDLEKNIALLAKLENWQRSTATDATWKGLLIVTTEQHRRLEQALANSGVEFDRMRYVRSEHHKLVYEKVTSNHGRLEFNAVDDFNMSKDSGSIPKVLVLKLLSCAGKTDLPLLTSRDFVKFCRQSDSLPTKINKHIGTAPFVMLGGGLLNPMVSFSFAAHFSPCFRVVDGEEGGKPPRYIALHPVECNETTEAIRKAELEADLICPEWPKVFDLERIDWDLPNLVDRLATAIRAR